MDSLVPGWNWLEARPEVKRLRAEQLRKISVALRRAELQAYERVADNLTMSKFALPLGDVDLGQRACMIARDVVYELRDSKAAKGG